MLLCYLMICQHLHFPFFKALAQHAPPHTLLFPLLILRVEGDALVQGSGQQLASSINVMPEVPTSVGLIDGPKLVSCIAHLASICPMKMHIL